jgi:hypothetical protein
MPYVTRDDDGHIIAVHASQSKQAQERLPVDDPGLRAFVAATGESANLQSALVSSDLEMVRVLEDLIARARWSPRTWRWFGSWRT